MKTSSLLVVGLLAGVAAFLMFQKPVGAAAETYIPTTAEIAAAANLVELDTYYELINELYVKNLVTAGQYVPLYDAYVATFYQLIEGGAANA